MHCKAFVRDQDELGYRQLQDCRFYQDYLPVKRLQGLKKLPDVATLSRMLKDATAAPVEHRAIGQGEPQGMAAQQGLKVLCSDLLPSRSSQSQEHLSIPDTLGRWKGPDHSIGIQVLDLAADPDRGGGCIEEMDGRDPGP